MTMPIWRLVDYKDRNSNGDVTKQHVVPASLQRLLIADLLARGMDCKPEIKTIAKTGMDQPGPIHSDRPWERFHVAGIEIGVPCEDVLYFLERIKALSERRFADGTQYFKLHSWTHCFVFKPVHKISFELQLGERVREAEQKALVFYSDKMKVGDVLRAAAAATRGVPIEQVPRLKSDRDRNDRFIPKERGQA